MRISREVSPAQIMTDQKQLENVEYFSYLGSRMTSNARRTNQIWHCHVSSGFQQEEAL
jgi:hypothetical protein